MLGGGGANPREDWDNWDGAPAEMPGGRLSLAQQRVQYRCAPPSPEEVLYAFERWQHAYVISGGTPDTNMLEVECFCHATQGRSQEFVSPSEPRCSRTRFVSFRY